jgi:hypothetical protein
MPLNPDKYYPSYIRYYDTHPSFTIHVDLDMMRNIDAMAIEFRVKKSVLLKAFFKELTDIHLHYQKKINELEREISNRDRQIEFLEKPILTKPLNPVVRDTIDYDELIEQNKNLLSQNSLLKSTFNELCKRYNIVDELKLTINKSSK